MRSAMQLLDSASRLVRARRLLVPCLVAVTLLWVASCYLEQAGNVIRGISRGLVVYQGLLEGWLWRAGFMSVLLSLILRLYNQGTEIGRWSGQEKGATLMQTGDWPRKDGVDIGKNEKRGVGDEDGGSHRIGAHFGASAGWDSCGTPVMKGAHVPEESTSACKGELSGSQEAISDKWLLAPRSLTARDKPLTVVLDLDDTLIMAKKTQEVPGNVVDAVETGLLSSRKLKFSHGNLEMDLTVIMRPGVRKFLEKVSNFAEVVVFTAGSAEYANPLINFLDPDGTLISGRLFRCSTVKTRYQEYVKDLSLLGRCLNQTVLLDDKPFSGLLQPYNVIPCAPFMGDPRDHQLMASYLPLLEHLKLVEDVRPVLKDVFQMHSYMVEWGVREEYLQKCLDNPGDTQHFRL